jgi:hypothetical protein
MKMETARHIQYGLIRILINWLGFGVDSFPPYSLCDILAATLLTKILRQGFIRSAVIFL